MTASTTARTVTNDTFVIERVYAAPPSRVFHAYADPATKRRWFGASDGWEEIEPSLDFTIGGHERAGGRNLASGQVHAYHAVYWDIVPDSRIVSTYEMELDGTRISVSLATTELLPEGDGTRLVYTEQGAFLDGPDPEGNHRNGTEWLLDRLAAVVESDR